MPKNDIHPKLKEVSYVFLDGQKAIIPSCYKNDSMTLEIDIFNHSAWRDKAYVNESIGSVAKFKQKFGMSGTSAFSAMSGKVSTKSTDTNDGK